MGEGVIYLGNGPGRIFYQSAERRTTIAMKKFILRIKNKKRDTE
jgi:hypothetical protein